MSNTAISSNGAAAAETKTSTNLTEAEAKISAMIPEDWTSVRVEKHTAPARWGNVPRSEVIRLLAKNGARLVKNRGWGDFNRSVIINGKREGMIEKAR